MLFIHSTSLNIAAAVTTLQCILVANQKRLLLVTINFLFNKMVRAYAGAAGTHMVLGLLCLAAGVTWICLLYFYEPLFIGTSPPRPIPELIPEWAVVLLSAKIICGFWVGRNAWPPGLLPAKKLQVLILYFISRIVLAQAWVVNIFGWGRAT